MPSSAYVVGFFNKWCDVCISGNEFGAVAAKKTAVILCHFQRE